MDLTKNFMQRVCMTKSMQDWARYATAQFRMKDLPEWVKANSADVELVSPRNATPAKKLGAMGLICSLLLCAVMSAPTVAMTGCTVSAAQIEANINLISQQAASILSQIGDTAIAADITAGVEKLKEAEAAWKGGGAVQDIISALNILEIAVGAVPLTAAYSPLVDVIVAGIEFILTNFVTTKAAPTGAVRAMALPGQYNPHKGRLVVKPHMMQSPSGAYKALWDKTYAATLPALGASKL